MQSDFRAALVHLCRRVLEPLISILIRFGVSAGELKAIVDRVYVHSAAEYLDEQGERVTYSRLAVVTGINRSVLPELLSASREGDFRPRSVTQLHRASRVLTGWYEDRDFQSRGGRPLVLPVTGDRRTFQHLVHRYSGGMYFQTVLSELERVGAVKRVDADSVRPVRRSLTAGGASAESVYSAGDVAGDLMATLAHNLAAPENEQLPVRSLVLEADARSLPLYRAQVGRRANALLELVESFLQTHRAQEPRRGTSAGAELGESAPSLPLGAAVFAICRPPSREQRRTK
ncbi:MAG TPA: DUF6502 family protein [Steroidobacteraceae bacterium]|nr:DUF6502 family protein [Steroidobacteraceae bacterium]